MSQLKPEFQAFIVDHKARPESSEEAKLAASRLTKVLGRSPSIIPLKWPAGVDPSNTKAFESHARRLRYQALGESCRRHSITHLLLGHHADDVAETVLLRLSRGHGRAGLQGISPVAQIPHCEGMHGVYESRQSDDDKSGHDTVSKVETGCVLVARPLLGFSKERLVATCLQAGKHWVNDTTNQDPTCTQRNAARSLLESMRLPVALRAKSLHAFAEKNRRTVAQEDQHVKSLIDACRVGRLDLRSGTMWVRVPEFDKVVRIEDAKSGEDARLYEDAKSDGGAAPRDKHAALKHRIAIKFIRELFDVVSHKETIDLRNFQGLPGLFFPRDFDFAPFTFGRKAKKLTFGGIMLEMLPDRSSTDDDNRATTALNEWLASRRFREGIQRGMQRRLDTVPSSQPQVYTRWRLHRQPFAERIRKEELTDTAKHPVVMFQGSQASPDLPSDASLRNPFWAHFGEVIIKKDSFALWDGRYWLRVYHDLPHPLLVTTYDHAQHRRFRDSWWKSGMSQKSKALMHQFEDDFESSSRDSQGRWTMPAISIPPDVPDLRRGTVVALPTMGWIKPGWETKLTWNIHYKKISMPDLVPVDSSIRWHTRERVHSKK